jgi:hypothetical protein
LASASSRSQAADRQTTWEGGKGIASHREPSLTGCHRATGCCRTTCFGRNLACPLASRRPSRPANRPRNHASSHHPPQSANHGAPRPDSAPHSRAVSRSPYRSAHRPRNRGENRPRTALRCRVPTHPANRSGNGSGGDSRGVDLSLFRSTQNGLSRSLMLTQGSLAAEVVILALCHLTSHWSRYGFRCSQRNTGPAKPGAGLPAAVFPAASLGHSGPSPPDR